MTQWWLACALLAGSLLAGCATRPPQPEPGVDWDERAARLVAQTEWRARGRIAYRSGKEGGQGSMSWTQAQTGTCIRVSGPFGAGAYEIFWDDRRVIVTSKHGERVASYTGRDAADHFVTEQLGWSFPAGSIRYWLLGVADPEYVSERRFDDAGWLSGIEQYGWSVRYDRFEKVGALYMPGRIAIENERARVKLIVDDWSLGPESPDRVPAAYGSDPARSHTIPAPAAGQTLGRSQVVRQRVLIP